MYEIILNVTINNSSFLKMFRSHILLITSLLTHSIDIKIYAYTRKVEKVVEITLVVFELVYRARLSNRLSSISSTTSPSFIGMLIILSMSL